VLFLTKKAGVPSLIHFNNFKIESTPKTLKKENHGGTEDTEAHIELLISTISFVKLRDLVP
jgi:hypothetical protein